MPVTPRDRFARVRKLAAKLPDVEETTTHGSPALKVRDALMAWIPTKKDVEPDTLAIRMSIVERDVLVSSKPNLFYLTPHYKDYPAVLVRLQHIKDADLTMLLGSAHEFVTSAKKRR